MAEIIDNYTHLNFRQITNFSELKVGMMVQVLERTAASGNPPEWKWHKLNDMNINAFYSHLPEKFLKWVRIPAY